MDSIENEITVQDAAAYTIAKVSGDVNWSGIPLIPIDKVLWTKDTGIRAAGQLCYDEEALYVHMRALERCIRAVYLEPLSPVCNDSCLEFFFRIDGDENYFNFEVNPNGCMCIQFGKKDRFDVVKENDEEYFDISPLMTSDGWEIYYRIPLEFIQMFHPGYEFDKDLMANMYKCGNWTVKKHFLAWAPIESELPNFHRPEYFQRMIFE